MPPARKLVFSLQLTVAQCSTFRQKGMKCKNWTAHAPIAIMVFCNLTPFFLSLSACEQYFYWISRVDALLWSVCSIANIFNSRMKTVLTIAPKIEFSLHYSIVQASKHSSFFLNKIFFKFLLTILLLLTSFWTMKA